MSEYGSHLPALRALSWVMPMRRVLEFGGGHYSTAFFLSVCEQLVTVEADPKWRAKLATEFTSKRHSVRVEAPTQLRRFDLIFIDDGANARQRVKTIRWVLSRPHPPVVIHDSEHQAYRDAIKAAGHDHIAFDTNPRTELVR